MAVNEVVPSDNVGALLGAFAVLFIPFFLQYTLYYRSNRKNWIPIIIILVLPICLGAYYIKMYVWLIVVAFLTSLGFLETLLMKK